MDNAIKALREIQSYQSDIRRLAKPLLAIAQDDIQRRFASSPRVRSTGEVYGAVRWRSLSDAYLRANPRREGGVQLVDTGLLRKSFVRGGLGNVTEATKGEIRFGSALPRAISQHRRRRLVVEHDGLIRATEDAVARAIAKIS
jgi:hypothetical protein